MESLMKTEWNLEPLFKPQSVAIVGASETSFFGSMLYKNLNHFGFEGRIYPINPKYKELFGIACYSSLKALPEPPDHVFVVVKRELVLDVLKEAVDAGAKSATIISAGFGETDEEEWKRVEDEILNLSVSRQFPVLGPNCLGAVNVYGRFNGFSAPLRGGVVPGGVALIMQSGGLLQGLCLPFYQRGIGLSYLISSGNNLCLDISDFIEYLVDDDNTRVICAYAEGIKQPEKFRRAAVKAAEAGKPIIMLKVGKSEKAVKATLAHTGSLAGSDAVINAIFDQYGIIRVSEFDELVETAAVFAKNGTSFPAQGGVGLITGSGGAVGLVSDLAHELDVYFPELEPSTREQLTALLPPSANVINPVDVTGQALNDNEMFRKTMQILSDDPNIAVIIYLMSVGLASTDTPQHQKMLYAIIDVADTISKPVLMCSLNSHSLDEWQKNFLEEHSKLPFTQGLGKTLKAVQSALNYAKFRHERNLQMSDVKQATDETRREKAVQYLRSIGRKILTEREGKELLSLYGIPVSKECRVNGENETVKAAESIGYPVVLKIDSPDILHKTEAGGVEINLKNKDEVIAAYRKIMDRVKRYKPDAAIHGILVQEFVTGGTEVIVGISRDSQFGHSIMFGIGGIFVEVFKDSVFQMPPLSRQKAEKMIRGIQGYPLLAGARGKPPKDIKALTETLLQISEMIVELGDCIEEMDINPLLVLEEGKGVKAVDALFVLQ